MKKKTVKKQRILVLPAGVKIYAGSPDKMRHWPTEPEGVASGGTRLVQAAKR